MQTRLGLLIAGGLVLVLALAGCGTSSTGEAPTPLATTTGAPTAAPTAGGRGAGDTLRLLWWQGPTILNPHLTAGTKDSDASRLVYEPLATYNAAGELVPILAAAIPTRENGDLAADGKSVVWRLRPNVSWSDGQPFTADDVKFTFEYVANADTAATTTSNISSVASVEVLDPTSVRIVFKDVTPAWATPFVGINGLIIPRHIFGDFIGATAREAPANLAPVGTGPYRVVEFKPGDIVIYEPNTNYRDPAKPFFSRVELKGGGDAASAARAVLQTGDVDFAWNLQVEASILNQLQSAGRGTILLNPGGNVEQIFLNLTDPNKEIDGERASLQAPHPFFTDQRVRRAFALAVDRATIVEQLYGPAGLVATNIVVSPPAVTSPNTTHEFNLDKARALLDEAGWVDSNGDGLREKDGVALQILFQSSTNPLRQKTQEIVKQSLEAIGFRVELKSVDSAVFFASDPANGDNINHFYADAQLYTTGSTSPDPGGFLGYYTSDQIAQKSNQWAGRNFMRWSNPEYDRLFAQSTTELDPQKRNQLLIQLNDLLINDGVIVPVVNRTFPNGASTTLAGVELTPWDSALWQVQDWTRTQP